MQSLLAQYFEIQQVQPGIAPSPALSAFATPVMDILVPAPPSPHPGKPVEDAIPVAAQALIDDLKAENARLRLQLDAQSKALNDAQSLADSDVLTPTLNRRAFLREMHRAMADCKRYGEQACLIYLDMDGFKNINDTYGHAAGLCRRDPDRQRPRRR
jgi:PleD family two-component response regulator